MPGAGAGAGAARGHPFLVGAGAGAGAYLKFLRPLTPGITLDVSRAFEIDLFI